MAMMRPFFSACLGGGPLGRFGDRNDDWRRRTGDLQSGRPRSGRLSLRRSAHVLHRLQDAVVLRGAKRPADFGRARRRLAFARRRCGRALAFACLAALLLIGVAPVGSALTRPARGSLPAPPADLPPPYGIIVLGGAIDDEISAARGQTALDEGAARLTEAAILARRYPSARIVYTGGSASLLGHVRPRRRRGGACWSRSGSTPRASRSKRARATPTRTRASPPRSSSRSPTRLG